MKSNAERPTRDNAALSASNSALSRATGAVSIFRLITVGAPDSISVMKKVRFVYWQDKPMWLGYLEEFPDYKTQGRTLAQLKENLRDLHDDLTKGRIPGVRRVADLRVA